MEQAQRVNNEIYIYETPAFSDEPYLHECETVIEKDGTTYYLYKKELIPDSIPGNKEYVEKAAILSVEASENIPDIALAEMFDVSAGISGDGELHVVDISENGSHWEEAFLFPIVITDYDADRFLMGDIEVDSTENLTEYADTFLQMLELPEDSYRIDEIRWDGDCYEEDGHLMRKATASGQKRMRDFLITYGGVVTWPEREGWHYRCTYKTADEKASVSEMVQETEAVEAQPVVQKRSFFKKLIEWLTERREMVIGLGGLVVLLANAFIWLWYYKKKKKEKEERWEEK